MIQAGSQFGTMSFDGQVLRLKRKGVTSFLSHGFKGEKTIPIASIASVQMKPAGAVFSGYLQLGVKGGSEGQGGLWQATQDENTLVFVKKDQPAFERLRDALLSAISDLNKPAGTPAQAGSLADELGKWAGLLSAGAITQQEFDEQKRKLLAAGR